MTEDGEGEPIEWQIVAESRFRGSGDGDNSYSGFSGDAWGGGGYGANGYGDGLEHGGGDGDSDLPPKSPSTYALFNPTKDDFTAEVIYANIFGARS